MFSILRRRSPEPTKPIHARLSARRHTQLLNALSLHLDGQLTPEEERALRLQLVDPQSMQVAKTFFHNEQTLRACFQLKNGKQSRTLT